MILMLKEKIGEQVAVRYFGASLGSLRRSFLSANLLILLVVPPLLTNLIGRNKFRRGMRALLKELPAERFRASSLRRHPSGALLRYVVEMN